MNASPGPEKEEKKINIYTCVLGLAEMELTFFVTACTVPVVWICG